MKIRLGYVATPVTLENYTYSKMVTYTRFQKLSEEEKIKKLFSLTKENLEHFEKILKYNKKYGVSFYRLSHNIIPLATHPQVSFDFITPFQKNWDKIAHLIQKNKMRIDAHPDQFYVLNSLNEQIVQNTKIGLEYHYQLFKLLQTKGICILHIGSSKGGKIEAIKRFEQNFLKLPNHLRNMIALENDDKVFTMQDTLLLCEKLKIPMVLDYLHYRCNHKDEKLKDYLKRICDTWKDTGLPPKMHFSSSKSQKEKRSHSYYINFQGFMKFLNELKIVDTDIDIMLECKGKDEALFRLIRQLHFFTNYSFLNATTFLLKKD